MNRVGSEAFFYELQVFLIERKKRWRVSFISVQPSKEIWMPRIKLQTSLHRFYKKTHMKDYIHACT